MCTFLTLNPEALLVFGVIRPTYKELGSISFIGRSNYCEKCKVSLEKSRRFSKWISGDFVKFEKDNS